ncbi:MAG: SIS domain-containing protein [bacterium]|nr:SIS domain-containing protein [bacterium]
MNARIKQRIQEGIEIKTLLLDDGIVNNIAQIITEIIATYHRGGKVILFGNGGSAADAQHIAAEFVGRFMKERKGLPAIALTVNTSIVTGVANDYGYEQVFVRQLEALATQQDLVIAISTSGNAANVNRAVEFAKSMGLKTVGLTGGTGGTLATLVDISVIIPTAITPRIQEAHITLGHIICELVEEELFK